MKTEIIKTILEIVINFYDINEKELFFSKDDTDKNLTHIKKVTAILLKEVGRVPIKEISNLFGESIIETRKKYLQGINRKIVSEVDKLSLKIRTKNAIKTNINKRRSKKYK